VPDPKSPPGEDKWAEFDRLRKTAQRYLDDTAPHFPAHFLLPTAHYENLKELPPMAAKGQRRCGSHAQVDSNLTLDASGLSHVICERPVGHAGQHLAPTGFKNLLGFGRRWQVAAWDEPSETRGDPKRRCASER
jgi:hypothetical protein